MSWENIRLLIASLVVIFLFEGDPDLWDRLHDSAMKSTTQECAK
jgi:hypothetical protein